MQTGQALSQRAKYKAQRLEYFRVQMTKVYVNRSTQARTVFKTVCQNSHYRYDR